MRWTLPLLLLATGCVSGGSGTGGLAIAGLLVYSQVAQNAAEGEQSAKSLWCGTLELTARQLDQWKGQGKTEDELVEELTQSVAQIGLANGYAMHRQQVRELILDAERVAGKPEALAHERKGCGG